MNKTIQSSSYRSYSESLMGEWIRHFDRVAGENFLYANFQKCLINFRDFVPDFTRKARELSLQDEIFQALDSNGKANYEKWLSEKISKALDVYWAPLSQAATQYSAPAYAGHVESLLNLKSKVEVYLDRLNQLAGASNANRITINDLVLFFDELTLIRLAPYSKTALIGIPFRALESASSSDEERLSSIAHELGHFLYWRLAPFNQINTRHQEILGYISESITSNTDDQEKREFRYIRTWFEELFADFVGASIAGNRYVESCKEMIKRNNRSSTELGENDQEHVADILRLLVCIYSVDHNRDTSLAAWQKFFTEDFPVDTTTIKIEAARENDTQRDIKRTPHELTPILLDTIDVLSKKMGKENRVFLQSTFIDISNASQFSDKAARLQTKRVQNLIEHTGGGSTALDIFLEPQFLEAGKQKHEHTWTTNSPHSHTETRSHSH